MRERDFTGEWGEGEVNKNKQDSKVSQCPLFDSKDTTQKKIQ